MATDILWLLVVGGGVLLLGIALIYGLMRWRKVTPAERRHAEDVTHENYEKLKARGDREPGVTRGPKP